jgi:putative ABC transport system permease protein
VVSPLTRKLLRDIWRLRSQVVTIALVVGCGVGGFIGSLSAYLSLVDLRDSYYDSARFAHVFATARRVPNSFGERIRALPGVLDVDLGIVGRTVVALPDVSDAMTGEIVSLPAAPASGVNRVVVKRGRWVESSDKDGVLLSEAFALARRLQPGDRLSILMNGRYQRVTIVGIALSPPYIFAAAPGGFSDDTNFAVIWMPKERLAAAYDMTGAFNHLAIRLQRDASVDGTIHALDDLLAPFGSSGAYGRKDQLSHRTLSQEIDEQRVFGTVMPAVFLAVAVFLLHVLLSRHIATERTQIAALKALGYDNLAIGAHYLGFTLATVLLGVAIGLAFGHALGSWLTGLYSAVFRFPAATFRMPAAIVLIGTGLAVFAALAAALNTVRGVVRLPAAEAMRPPAPAKFTRTLLERTRFGRWLAPAVRMIARELERQPVRAIIVTLGIASSIAILIAGTWWGDAFDFLIERELFARERAQVLVALNEARDASALYDVERLPGVLEAEGVRSVAVKLHHGRYSYRTALTGIDPGARLRLVQGPADEALSVEADSILLTDRLASVLHARVGSTIEVESLEGRRDRHMFVVSGLTGDLMGMQAYVLRRAAARLVGEGDTLNVARVRIDDAQRDAFFAAVRDTPSIAAAGDKDRMVRHFRSTQARNLLIFAAILSACAACIAVGVVYNSARIQLAEHAWELATLRVVGFTRAEVSWMLLGQLGLQILLAIPLGCLGGYSLALLIVTLISAEEFRIPLVVTSETYATAILVMLAAGTVSALIVRRHIDRLDMIGVLKTRE